MIFSKINCYIYKTIMLSFNFFIFLNFFLVYTLVNFWNFFFWLGFVVFFFNLNNFLKLIIYSEIVWLTLYFYSTYIGSTIDDLNTITLSLFLIGFAAIEVSLGLMFTIFFKNIKSHIFVDSSLNINSDYSSSNTVSFLRSVWSSKF